MNPAPTPPSPRLGVVLPSGGEMVTTPIGSVIVTHFESVGTHVAVFDQPDRDPAVMIHLDGKGQMSIELRDQPVALNPQPGRATATD